MRCDGVKGTAVFLTSLRQRTSEIGACNGTTRNGNTSVTYSFFFLLIKNFWILMVVSLHFHYHPLIDGLSYFIKHEYFGPTCSNRRTVWNLSTIISDVKNVIVFEENFKLATDMTEIIYLRAQFVHFSIYLFINSFM